jgi:hypothetical protein
MNAISGGKLLVRQIDFCHCDALQSVTIGGIVLRDTQLKKVGQVKKTYPIFSVGNAPN